MNFIIALDFCAFLYQQAYDIMKKKPQNEQQHIYMQLQADQDKDLCHYDLLTFSDEVAAILPGDGPEQY